MFFSHSRKKTTLIGIAAESYDVIEFVSALKQFDAYGRLFAMKEFRYGCRIID
tara:strand:- start:138 stop:296 length:159 start_codon:yes stop_codon:yes gene_type:complete